MMIIMRADASPRQIEIVVDTVESHDGWKAHLSAGVDRTIIGVVGMVGTGVTIEPDLFLTMPGVDRIVPISRPYKLASREFRPMDSVFP